MNDTLTFTLDEENEKRFHEILYSVDTEKTEWFTIHDKYGHEAKYVKVIECKDCKYYEGLARCELIGGCMGTHGYCAWAERKNDE